MNKILCPISEAASTFPDSPAIVFGARSITYSQLESYVWSTVKYLKKIGIKPNDKVALVCDNCVEYVIVLFALWRMEAIACPLNPRLPSRSLVDYIHQLDAQVLLSSSHKILSIPQITLRKFYIQEMINFDIREGTYQETASVQLGQEATFLYTSGTSNEPKLAVHTYGNYYWNAIGANENIPLKPSDRWLLSLPLHHVGGLAILFRIILSGAVLVIGNPQNDMGETLAKYKITHVSFVLTQLYRILGGEKKITAFSHLKAVLLGGSGIPQSLLDSAIKNRLPVFLSYGLTEMSSQVATTHHSALVSPEDPRVKMLKFRELKIAHDGEILVRGESLFKGYMRNGKIFLPLTEDGWFKTGDLGTLDHDGNLFVLGRKDNMFVSGGENIQPEEIERCLYNFSGVEKAVVIPAVHPEFGFRPVAFIKASDSLNKNLLVEHLGKFLPRFKIPMALYDWPADLEIDNQKDSRRKLQDFFTV